MEQARFFEYLSAERRFSPHTITAYRNDLNQFFSYIENTYDNLATAELKHTHIRSWVVHMMQDGLKARSINRKLSCLKSFFRFLRKRGKIEHNPMQKVIAPKTGKRLPVVIKEKEVDFLLERLTYGSDFSGVRDKTIIELLYHTGMRRSELIRLSVSDIDFAAAQLKVLGKGNKERLIPFSPQLAGALRHYLEMRGRAFEEISSDRVFLTDRGQALYPKWVYNLARKYLSQVSTAEQRGPHVLRHSFATHLSNNGADLNAIKELLGHASLSATQVYTHNSIEKLKNVYQQAHPKAKKQQD